jgi:U3 small nucleolar RNA-associated protein 14
MGYLLHREKAEKEKKLAALGRRDAKLQMVQISEKFDKKAAKLTTTTLPYPFTSKEAFDRSLRLPLGRQYNTDASFRDMTRPAVLTNTGEVIEPIQFAPEKRAATDNKAGGGKRAKTKN